MIKKPFFGFGNPKLDYAGIEGLEQGEVINIPFSGRAVFLWRRLIPQLVTFHSRWEMNSKPDRI